MDGEEKELLEQDLADLFNEILARHLDRLLGSRHGIDGVPMNLGTIGCISLLVEGLHPEGEPLPDEHGLRTLRDLKDGLREIGLKRDAEVEPVVEELIQRQYILLEEERVRPGKPALSMAQVLERLFPKMNGTAFVAYLIQTIDEVSTGRKSLEAAAVQFDQTLKMHGVPIRRPKDRPIQRQKGPESHAPSGGMRRELSHGEAPRSAGPTLVRREEDRGVRILGSSASSLQYDLRDVETVNIQPVDHHPPPEVSIEEEIGEPVENPAGEEETSSSSEEAEPAQDSSDDITADTPLPEPDEPAEEVPLPVTDSLPQGDPTPASPPAGEMQQPPSACVPAEEDGNLAGPDLETDSEDLIEEQIAGFEENLASQCPLCGEGRIQSQETPAGRSYYRCNNRQCSFISWGKPVHLPCPRCRNPFMVEASDAEGRPILKCPRATCRYTQTPPRADRIPPAVADKKSDVPRRRVVRRRVVRRKK